MKLSDKLVSGDTMNRIKKQLLTLLQHRMESKGIDGGLNIAQLLLSQVESYSLGYPPFDHTMPANETPLTWWQ